MRWISTKDRLPEEGKYVLARHNRGTWYDSTDQANVNCVVVKLVKGISKKERELMRSGKSLSHIKANPNNDVERWNSYRSEDEFGNNMVDYNWWMFGSDSFFGQEITHWFPIDRIVHLQTESEK